MRQILPLFLCGLVAAGCGARTGSTTKGSAPGGREAISGSIEALGNGSYEIRNAGSTVNSASNEYGPALTNAGERLYFVSDRPGGVGGHDLWLALRSGIDNALFEQSRPIDTKFNTRGNEGAMTVSADGSLVVYTACEMSGGMGDCDLYESHPRPGEPAPSANMRAVNSSAWESEPSLSPDGRTLFFSSNRPGTLGGGKDADIYISTLGSDGKWSTPRNPGPPLNSPKKEDSPSVSPDGRMIFFSSARDGGEGGLDFYVSHRADDGTWSEPVNLGPLLNTSRDDRFIWAGAGANQIFFASERTDIQNYGKLDIFIARRTAGN